MKTPTREQVVGYAAQLGVVAIVAANFHAHCTENNWHMKDGNPMRNWKVCFRLWVEAIQGRAGQEIVLHDQPHTNDKLVARKQRQADDFRRDDIIRQGRKSGATDERIGEVLTKYGVSW